MKTTAAAMQANPQFFGLIPGTLFSKTENNAVQPAFLTLNPDQLRYNLTGLSQALGTGVTGPTVQPTQNYSADEKNYSTYFRANFEADVGVPMDGNIGVRVVKVEEFLNGIGGNAKNGYIPVKLSTSHTNALPSLNLRLSLTDNDFVRFGYSRAISRPDFGYLRNFVQINPPLINGVAFTRQGRCQEREDVLDLFESLTGARLLYGFHQVGGTRYDIPAGWAQKCRATVDKIDGRISEFEAMLESNAFFMARTQGVGTVSRELAQEVGISGPLIRGSGVNYDIRRAEPYSSYEDFDFKVPVEMAGDCLARYRVRMVEFRESIKIVRQALDGLPEGPISSRPGVKSVGQVRIPKGEAYARVEGARGEVGCYLIADGSAKPYRMKWRGASFSNLAILPHIIPGHKVADVVAIMGSVDPVFGEVDR